MKVFFSINKSINVINHINKLKNKKIWSSQDILKKDFDKIQHLLLIKNFQEIGKGRTYLKIIKAIYDKPTTNIILNSENLKVLLLGSGRGQGYPLSPFFLNMALEVRVRAIREENKRNPNWKRSKTVTVCI